MLWLAYAAFLAIEHERTGLNLSVSGVESSLQASARLGAVRRRVRKHDQPEHATSLSATRVAVT